MLATSRTQPAMTSRVRENLDLAAAILGVVAGIAISCLNFIYSNEYLLTMGPLLAAMCLFYIFFRRRLLADVDGSLQGSRRLTLAANIIFWLAFAASLYTLSTQALLRPPLYFILTSVCASMVAVQIMDCRTKTGVAFLLFQTLLLSLSVSASAFYVPNTIPGIDSWEHMSVAEQVVAHGGIVKFLDSGRLNYYYSLPVMHLNVAIVQMVTGASFKTAMFLGAGLPLILSTLFVYLLGSRLAKSDKIGLLAALLVGLSDYHIMWSSQNIIAMSIGIVLFSIILWLLLCQKERHGTVLFLTLLLLATLVLTHTISPFILGLVLMVFLLTYALHRRWYPEPTTTATHLIAPAIVVLFLTAVVTHWTYAYLIRENLSFFDAMVKWYYDSITREAALLVTRPEATTAQHGLLGPMLNIAGYLLLVGFGIVGCLLWISPGRRNSVLVPLVMVLIMTIGLPLSFSLFGISNIEQTRWFAFYYILLGIVAAVGLVAITTFVRNYGIRNGLVGLFIFSYTFFMTTNSVSNTDSPLYASAVSECVVYKESEVAAARMVDEVYEGKIVTDDRYAGSILTNYLATTDPISSQMLDEDTQKSGLIVWRNVLAQRPASISAGGLTRLLVLGESYEQVLSGTHCLLYRNDSVSIFSP